MLWYKKTWLTEALKSLIKVKYKLYVQYKKCKSVHKSTICKQFNSFFVNIGPTLSRSFDGYIGSPQKYLTNQQISSLFLSPVTNNEIHKILNSLNDSAPGHDEIRLGPVKSVLQYIDGPFTYICNLSLNQGVFPDILKIANVIPLYKKEDPMIFSNYRPVSLLCSLSKVLEKIMYNRVRSLYPPYPKESGDVMVLRQSRPPPAMVLTR